MLCCFNSDIRPETNLNDLEIMCSLILKLSHLNTMHQVLLVLIAVPACLRAGVAVGLYLSNQQNTPIHLLMWQKSQITNWEVNIIWEYF